MKKVQAKDGKFGFVDFTTEINKQGAGWEGGWVKITGKGTQSSYFDTLADTGLQGSTLLKVGDIIYLKEFESSPLLEGDAAAPLKFSKAQWCTDVNRSESTTIHDATSQGDVEQGVRDYVVGIVGESTGSLNGYMDLDDAFQREIESRFITRIVDDGAKITKLSIDEKPVMTFFCFREETTVGEVEVWLFRELYLSGLTTDKPLDGTIPFNLSYTVGWRAQYERRITA